MKVTVLNSYVKKNVIIIIIIISILSFLLFMFELKSYYFPFGNVENNMMNNNNIKLKENYNELNLEFDKEFSDIFNYLEESEYTEKKFKDNDIGCYDNNKMIEQILGVGNTCKKISNDNTYQDIYEKSIVDSNGKSYSFSELCPETTGQERPILCLYNKGNHINKLNNKLSNMIDYVQNNHENRLNKLENSTSYHIVDNNRLYNMPHIKKFNQFEKHNNMGMSKRFNNEDYIDDFLLFSAQQYN
jgi:hypothetical protein